MQPANSGINPLAWHRKAPLFFRQSDCQISTNIHEAIQKIWSLISCLAVAVLSLVQHIKVFYLWKRCRNFFFSFNIFYKLVNIFIVLVYKTVQKILIFHVEFTKKIILISLFTPHFFIRKFINVGNVGSATLLPNFFWEGEVTH